MMGANVQKSNGKLPYSTSINKIKVVCLLLVNGEPREKTSSDESERKDGHFRSATGLSKGSSKTHLLNKEV